MPLLEEELSQGEHNQGKAVEVLLQVEDEHDDDTMTQGVTFQSFKLLTRW